MVNERSDLTVTMLRFDPERDPIVIDEWEWDNPHIAAEEEAVERGIEEAFEREPPVMFVSMSEEITTLVLGLSVFGGGDVGPAWLQCIIGTQIYGSGEADIPTMTSDWVIADI